MKKNDLFLSLATITSILLQNRLGLRSEPITFTFIRNLAVAFFLSLLINLIFLVINIIREKSFTFFISFFRIALYTSLALSIGAILSRFWN